MTAKISTPKIDLTSLSKPELTFWCHMFSDSSRMGELHLDIESGRDITKDIKVLTGDKGDNWFEVNVDLSDYKTKRSQLIFRNITGPSWDSDICIDDITIKDGNTAIANRKSIKNNFSASITNCRLNYYIPNSEIAKTTISIFSAQGKTLSKISNLSSKQGMNTIQLSSSLEEQGHGIYFVKITHGNFNKTIKWVLR